MRLIALSLVLIVPQVLAHSGGTDSSGCHAGSKPRHCHGSSTPNYSDSGPSYNETPPSRPQRYEIDKPQIIPKSKPKRFTPPKPYKDGIGLIIKVLFVIVIGFLTSMLFVRKQPKIEPKRTKCRQLFNKTKYWVLRSKKRYFR